jgi:siroheme synthase (precorrin-2 oxidase/ferrochelatase)
VNNAVDGSTALKRNQLLLDNQADVSIIHPDLLTHLNKADHELKINGVGGEQLIVQDTGYLTGFF